VKLTAQEEEEEEEGLTLESMSFFYPVPLSIYALVHQCLSLVSLTQN
jgi:hypothetical protein